MDVPAIQVLADVSLYRSITDFLPGYPYFVHEFEAREHRKHSQYPSSDPKPWAAPRRP